MTHSLEPWERGEENQHECDLLDADGKRIGKILQAFGITLPHEAPQKPGGANVDRILACVNACAGIPTEDLLAIAEKRKRENRLFGIFQKWIPRLELSMNYRPDKENP